MDDRMIVLCLCSSDSLDTDWLARGVLCIPSEHRIKDSALRLFVSLRLFLHFEFTGLSSTYSVQSVRL